MTHPNTGGKKKREKKIRKPSLAPSQFLSILIQILLSSYILLLGKKFPTPPLVPLLLRRARRHGHRPSCQAAAAAPALPRDDTGGDRGAERQERVEQVGDLRVHRGQVRRSAAGACVASDGAPGAHEGVRRAHLPQEQLLPRRRARRAAQAGPWSPAQTEGPQRAAAQAVLPAPPRPPAKGQGPASRRRRQGYLRHAQGPRPPAQESQDRPRRRPHRRRRLRLRQARPRPAP